MHGHCMVAIHVWPIHENHASLHGFEDFKLVMFFFICSVGESICIAILLYAV